MIAVREVVESGIVVVEPGPRLTLENAGEVLKIVKGVMPTVRPTIIINMAATTVLDSSGVGMLVNARKHIQALNGDFALAELRPEVHRMLQLMNLHQLFDIFETVPLAEKHFAARNR
jgi:anti-sigma B factor antagonist